MVELKVADNAVLLPVKAVPGASRTRCAGEWNGRAKIAVAAPPEQGKANQAIIAFLADLLQLRRRDVSIVAGTTSPLKTVRIEGVTVERVRKATGL